MNGLYLIGKDNRNINLKISKKKSKLKTEILKKYNIIKENQQFQQFEKGGRTNSSSKILTLLNAISLNKNAIDISSSSILMRSDTIGFNEP